MKSFRYRAYDAGGSLQSGVVTAPSESAALASLTSEGKFPVELRSALDATGQDRWWEVELWTSRRTRGERLAAIVRDLATLLEANVPLEEALRLLREVRSANASTQRTASALHAAVLEGSQLSDAMATLDDSFPDYIRQLVRSGERSGRLGVVLSEIADFLESATKRRTALAQALVYPAILLTAAVAAMTVVVTVLVPTIVPLYKDAGVAPPLVVATLAALLDFITTHWMALVVATVLAIVGLGIMRRSEAWRTIRDKLVLRLPVVAGLVTDTQTARFSRTMSTLLHNGVPMLDAVDVVGEALDNRTFRTAAHDIERQIEGGVSFSQAMTGTGLFAPINLRLVAIGEKTGSLDTMLSRIAQQCESRVDRQIAGLMTLLAPTLTVLIGGFVGMLVVSVMGAVTSLNDLMLR